MPIETKIVITGQPESNRNVKKFAKIASKDINRLEKDSIASSKKMSTAFQGIGKTLGAIGIGLGFATIFRGLKTTIQLASDTEESVNKVREVFGAAATSIESFSKKAATSIGASRQEALAMTGELGNLLVAFGFTGDKAANMSADMVQLAADLGSFNNVPTVDALNAIRSALVGESEPIRRFGADVRQARLDQIALAEGLEFTKGKMDSQTKALAAIKAIMLDTKKAQGDFSRTSEGAANASKILEANVKDLAASLGQELLPTVNRAILALNSLFAGDTEKSIERFNKLLTDKVFASLLSILVPASAVTAGLATIREEAEKLKNVKFEFVGPQTEEQLEAIRLQALLKAQQIESNKALKRDKELRDSILAGLKLQEDKLRIINQLKTEGLIPLTEEEKKQKAILLAMQQSQPILEILGKEHVGIVEALEEDVFFTNMLADAQQRWTDEASKTKQQLFEAAGILNEIALLATKRRKFSFSSLLGIGASIAGLIPGGQGFATGLTAASIATRGFQGGGRPVTGRPNIVGEDGPERFIPDTPGTIVPNHEINNNQKINVQFIFQTADEITIKTKVIPIINDYVNRQGGKLLASGVV